MAIRLDPALVRRVSSAVGLVLVCAMLSILRQQGVGALDTIWAEDGTIFLQDAIRSTSPGLWFEQYGGYVHLLPRLMASAAAVLPIEWASLWMSGGAAFLSGIFGWVVFGATRNLIPGTRERFVLSICVVALPIAAIEVINASANLHWYLLFVASCVAMSQPSTRSESVVGCAVLFVAAASDPFVVALTPVMAWNLLSTRQRFHALGLAALLAGLAIQAAVILAGESERQLNPFSTPVANLVNWYGLYVLATSVFGVAIRDSLVAGLGPAVTGAMAAIILFFLALPAFRLALRKPFIPAFVLGLHLWFYFVPVALSGFSPSRYAVTPILLLYLLIAWGLADSRFRPVRVIRIVALALLAVITIVDFSPLNPRASGPSWSAGLVTAGKACASATDTAALQIAPAGSQDSDGDDWSVTVPCSLLRSRISD